MPSRPVQGKCRAAAAADAEIAFQERQRQLLAEQQVIPPLELVMPQLMQPQLVPQMSYASAGGFSMRDMQLYSMFVGHEFQQQRDHRDQLRDQLRDQQRDQAAALRLSDFQSALLNGKLQFRCGLV